MVVVTDVVIVSTAPSVMVCDKLKVVRSYNHMRQLFKLAMYQQCGLKPRRSQEDEFDEMNALDKNRIEDEICEVPSAQKLTEMVQQILENGGQDMIKAL